MKKLFWRFFNKEKYRNYIILNWIVKAKEYYYYNKHSSGMCCAFNYNVPKYFEKEWNKIDGYDNIKHFIPEYYPEFFGTHEIEYDEELDNSAEEGYWWHITDEESRIKAFDKLIEIYEQKLQKVSN